MSRVYEVFRFVNGKSRRKTEGPVTYIEVEDGEDKYAVLAASGILGTTYGYGLCEIVDLDAEYSRLADFLEPTLKAQETLLKILNRNS